MAIKTRAVAGAATPLHRLDYSLTHAVDTRTGQALCGTVKPENLLDDSHATNENAPATCAACNRKDPRNTPSGPFVLASLIQVR